jgi:hypothetical protein
MNAPVRTFPVANDFDDEVDVAVYGRLFRALEVSPIEGKPKALFLAARYAAFEIAQREQQARHDLYRIASETGLVKLIGKVAVRDLINTAFGATSPRRLNHADQR